MSIQIRIFMGYIQNKEIKIHLDQSPIWKEAKLLGGELCLLENRWQEKDYIGLFLPHLMTYPQLKEKEQKVKIQLQIYCPKLNLDKHSIYLFSQCFVC